MLSKAEADQIPALDSIKNTDGPKFREKPDFLLELLPTIAASMKPPRIPAIFCLKERQQQQKKKKRKIIKLRNFFKSTFERMGSVVTSFHRKAFLVVYPRPPKGLCLFLI